VSNTNAAQGSGQASPNSGGETAVEDGETSAGGDPAGTQDPTRPAAIGPDVSALNGGVDSVETAIASAPASGSMPSPATSAGPAFVRAASDVKAGSDIKFDSSSAKGDPGSGPDQSLLVGPLAARVPGTKDEPEPGSPAKDRGAIVESEKRSNEIREPQTGNLLVNFLPLDRTSLEKAIDRFLDRFEGITSELAELEGSTDLLPMVTAFTIAAVATEAIRRRQRDLKTRTGVETFEGPNPLAGLPISWSYALVEK
jgi:hypothetical protein